jgi:hypothetical protein
MSEQAKTNSLLEKILLAFTPKEEPKEKPETEVKLGAIKVADGSVSIEYDGEELAAGVSCWIMAEDGEKVPVPVGEHPLEDGSILVVSEEGICSEIRKEEQAPEEAQEMATPEAKDDAKIAQEIESAIKSILIKYTDVSAKVAELEKANLELKEQVVELSKEPAAKPIKSTVVQMEAKGKFKDLINKINK